MLSQTAEYALRAMTWMALLPTGEAIRTRDLSDATRIPQHYLSKILRRLVLRDLLVSQKGRGGGFQLSRAPEKITFQQILDAVDGAPKTGVCAFGWGSCSGEEPCPLHDAWSEMNTAFQRWAEQTTLADISPHESRRFPAPPGLPGR